MKPMRVAPPIAALVLLSGPVAWAQEAEQSAAKQAVSISTRVSVAETMTDNVALSKDAKSDQITEISPGIRINIDGTRLKTYFDYSLHQYIYAQGTSGSRLENELTTYGTFEAVDNWAFVDFSGSISQQTISAYGTQSNTTTAINANKTEVSSYTIAPYLRGRLGDSATYETRITQSVSSSDSSSASNSADTNSVVKVANASAFRQLGWTAEASRQTVDYSTGRTTEADDFSLGLTYELTPQVNLSADAGREASNYTSLDKQNFNTRSVGFTWKPSERTTLSAMTGQRSYGNKHNLSFVHRSAHTVWRISDSKDVSVNSNQNGTSSSAYEQANTLFSAVSDSTLRAQLVEAYLQSNSSSLNGYLTSAISLQRRQDLSLALQGIRDTITFALTRTETTRLDTVSSAVDDLSNGATVIQNGYSVNFSHRLTPDYSLGVQLSRQNTSGSTTTEETILKSLNINLTSNIGKKAAATLGLRRVLSDSASNPYTENAVTGNLNVQF